MEEEKEICGVIYLYNGGPQPEIWSVRSLKEAHGYAAIFKDNRLHIEGETPFRLDVRSPVLTTTDKKALPYDWRKVRGGGGTISFVPSSYQGGRPK